MTKRYTEGDVMELVNTVNAFLDSPYSSDRSKHVVKLGNAVRPFLPDPDEEAIEKMALAMHDWSDQHQRTDFINKCTNFKTCSYREQHIAQARAALAAYRQHMEEQ